MESVKSGSDGFVLKLRVEVTGVRKWEVPVFERTGNDGVKKSPFGSGSVFVNFYWSLDDLNISNLNCVTRFDLNIDIISEKNIFVIKFQAVAWYENSRIIIPKKEHTKKITVPIFKISKSDSLWVKIINNILLLFQIISLNLYHLHSVHLPICAFFVTPKLGHLSGKSPQIRFVKDYFL